MPLPLAHALRLHVHMRPNSCTCTHMRPTSCVAALAFTHWLRASGCRRVRNGNGNDRGERSSAGAG
eukprot:382543-Pleurochrysis_carterae.AAC.1